MFGTTAALAKIHGAIVRILSDFSKLCLAQPVFAKLRRAKEQSNIRCGQAASTFRKRNVVIEVKVLH
jgi:hypothetical protein